MIYPQKSIPIGLFCCTHCVTATLQARQKAEVSTTDAEDKLKAFVSSAAPRSGEARRGSKGGQEDQAKAMADLDASLMQRLDEDSATNHKLMESLKATQVAACIPCTRTVLCLDQNTQNRISSSAVTPSADVDVRLECI